LALAGALVVLAQDIQKLVRNRLVDHVVEHLSELHPDSLLTQPRLLEFGPFYGFIPWFLALSAS
jgi:hypothetical protein